MSNPLSCCSGSFPSFSHAFLRSTKCSYEPRNSGICVGRCRPQLAVTEILGFPSLPLLVVIRITPFAPRIPYTAVDEASFNTERLSISFASSCENDSCSTPSIIIRGEASLKVDLPRIRMVAASSPGRPLGCWVITPGSLPTSALVTLATGAATSSLLFIILTAPVTVCFFCDP